MSKELILKQQIEQFNTLGIVDEVGNVDYAKYQRWFIDTVSKNLNGSTKLADIIDAVEFANQISTASISGIPNFSVDMVNGLFNKDELTNFVLKRVDVKDLATNTLDLVSNELKDDNNIEHLDDTPLTKEEKIDNVKSITKPLLDKLEDEKDVSLKEEIIANLKDILLSNKIDEKDIEGILIKDENDESEKEVKKSLPVRNIYTDYRFIFYMWTLGYDYSRFLFEERPILGKNRIFKYIKEDSKKEKFTQIKKYSRSCYDQKYAPLIFDFNYKYGLKLDIELLRDQVTFLSKEEYSEHFKKDFIKSYEECKSNVKDILEFFVEFDNIYKTIAEEEKVKYQKFGNMDNTKAKELLVGLREKDCNITLKITNEVKTKFPNFSKADSNALATHIETNFTTKMLDAGYNPKRASYLIKEAIEYYKILKDVHESRNAAFRFISRTKYNNEKQALRNMETLINKETDPYNQKIIQESLHTKTNYKDGYENELEKLNEFQLENIESTYEFVDTDDQKKTEILIENEVENDVELEKYPEVVNEIEINR